MPISLTEHERNVLEHLTSGLTERETYLRLGLAKTELDIVWQEISEKIQSSIPATMEDYELLTMYQRVERQRLEAELWASEARLGALMDTAPEAVLIIEGRSGKILRINNQASVMFGYSPRELLGHSMEMLVPDELRKIHVSYRQGFVNSVRKREIGYHPLIMARRKDGTMTPIEIGLTATASTEDVMVLCRPVNSASVEMDMDESRAFG